MDFFENIQFNILFLIKKIYKIYIFVKNFYIAQKNLLKNKINQLKNKIKQLKTRLKNFLLLLNYKFGVIWNILNIGHSNIIEYEQLVVEILYKDMIEIDYHSLYPKLIRNLDKKSIKCVDNIISKIKLVAKDKIFKNGHIFSFVEQFKIKMLLLDLFFNIKKINDKCYKYKKYFLPQKHFEASVFYYKHNIDSLNKNNFQNKDFIDVGAYIGDSAIVLSPYTKGNIYSFEPTSEIYDLLQETLKLNPKCKNIIPVKKGLGAKFETKTIHVLDSGSSINRVILNDEHETETIEITTLDDFVKENNLNNIGLIKVDIEGFEQEFLKGALNTIKTQKPTLLLSIYHFADDFFNIKSIIENFNLCYNFKITKPIDGSVRGEILLICEQ